MSIAVRLLLAS